MRLKKVNRVLLLFIFFLVASTAALYNYIQSEEFGKVASSKIQKELYKKFKIEAMFKKINIGLFPPSIGVQNISIYQKNEFSAKFEKAKVSFGLSDMFSQKLSIGKLELNSAVLKIQKSTTSKEIKLQDIYPIIQHGIANNIKYKLKKILLNNVQIEQGAESVFVNNANVGIYNSIITIVSEVRNLKTNLKVFKKIGNIDGLIIDGQLSEKQMRIKEFSIFQKLEKVSFGGVINTEDKIYIQDGILEINGSISRMEDVYEEFNRQYRGQFKGFLNLKTRINGNSDELKIDGLAKLGNLRTPYGEVDTANIEFVKEGAQLIIKNGVIEKNNGKVRLDKEYILDLSNINEKISLSLYCENMHSNDILQYVPTLNPLKFVTEGRAKLIIQPKSNPVVEVEIEDKIKLDRVRLKIDDKKIFDLKEAITFHSNSNIKVMSNGLVYLNMKGKIRDGLVQIDGRVDENEVESSIKLENTLLDDIGPISGTTISGKSDMQIIARGRYSDVNFGIRTRTSELNFLGINLGDAKGELQYSLAKNLLSIKSIEAKYKDTQYTTNGNVSFLNQGDINLDFKILKGTYYNLREILPNVIGNINNGFQYIGTNIKGSFNLKGNFDSDSLRVIGAIRCEAFSYLNEDFERGRFDFKYEDLKLTVNNLKMVKGLGEISGRTTFNTKTSDFDYQFVMSNLRFNDFSIIKAMNIGYTGELIGEMYGKRVEGVVSTRTQLKIINAHIANKNVSDSVLTIYNNKNDIYSTLNILGNKISIDSYINMIDKGKVSYVNGTINSGDIKELLGILSAHNAEDDEIEGGIAASFSSNFNFKDLEKISVKLKVERIKYSKDNIDLNQVGNPIDIEIENGGVVRWKFNLEGEGIGILSNAKIGSINKLEIDNKFNVESSILKLLTNNIEKSEGRIEGRQSFRIKNGEWENNAEITGLIEKLSIKQIPGVFNDVEFELVGGNQRVLLEKLQAKYGGGEVEVFGETLFKFPYPYIKYRYNLKDIKAPLFKKSNVLFSAKGDIIGDSLPYLVDGKFKVLGGNIIDEIKDIAGTTIDTDSYKKYIPKNVIGGQIGLLNSNIDIVFERPIIIKNGLMDIDVNGRVNLFGNAFSPFKKGEVKIASNDSKLIFKSHEFLLSRGRLKLIDESRKEKPEVDFFGKTKINEYDLTVNVFGSVDNLNVELNSTPSLSQEDILSLLTLGVTTDVNKNLGERQRQSVTTLSIGSFLVDQLKINRNLNESLGLRLSLQPEFSQDESNLVDGKSSDTSKTSGRYRSTTKIKLQKKISDKLDVSVSSTLGGTTEQKQEMNLNYKYNKKWSLEGVYEIKSSDEVETDSSDSLGADIKYRFSF